MLQIILGVALVIMLVLLWLAPLSELLCLFFADRTPVPRRGKPEPLPRLLFLVPAHNEQLMITRCVKSLLDMAYPPLSRHVVVVADNCQDATARLALEQGADTLERSDPASPGKPRALAWALSQLELDQYDACVIVDADSVVAPGFASGIAALAPLNDIVFQPNNLTLNEFESWLTRLGGLLGRCRFEVTNPLKQAAGLNVPIANGMGIGTNLLIRDGWRSTSITEDSELYALYTEEGVRIRHARGANIFSQESTSLAEGGTQRRRWLSGRLQVALTWGSRIIHSQRIGWRQKLDLFVELALASPVLHLVIAVAVSIAAIVALPSVVGRPIAYLAVASLAGIVVTTIVAIAHHPQPVRTVLAFVMLPIYATWRLALLIGTLITLNDTTWRRTVRVASSPSLTLTRNS